MDLANDIETVSVTHNAYCITLGSEKMQPYMYTQTFHINAIIKSGQSKTTSVRGNLQFSIVRSRRIYLKLNTHSKIHMLQQFKTQAHWREYQHSQSCPNLSNKSDIKHAFQMLQQLETYM